MKTLKEQTEIVKQRLHYHFAKVGGGWNIEGMNAPFMNEFLNEVERLCALSDVVGQSEQLVCDYYEAKNGAKDNSCRNCGRSVEKHF